MHYSLNGAVVTEWQSPNLLILFMEIKPDQYFEDIQFAAEWSST
ncbi:hypothetical protein [Fulvivirga marina]|nr:hypothetical protein [Fulvivirga marina]